MTMDIPETVAPPPRVGYALVHIDNIIVDAQPLFFSS